MPLRVYNNAKFIFLEDRYIQDFLHNNRHQVIILFPVQFCMLEIIHFSIVKGMISYPCNFSIN